MTKDNIETELKFEISAEQAERLYGSYSFGKFVYQLTVMFDRSNELWNYDARLRLRKTGELATLDYKKPLSRFGVKRELEKTIRVDSFENAEAILRLLNYFPISSYEKYRAETTINGLDVAIDKYPFGFFVEIEGEEKRIWELADSWRLEGNLTASCDDLYVEKMKAWEKDPKDHILFKDFENYQPK